MREQEPVPPRRLRPELPRDLETVCLKCLAKNPARRYPTAEALFDDLRRFLDGKPISARPVGAAEKCLRLARRHPGVTGLLFLVFAVTLGSLVAVTALWRRAEERGELARERERLATRRLETALDVLDRYSDMTLGRMEVKAPVSPAEKAALLEVVRQYEELIADAPDDRTIRYRYVKALDLHASLLWSSGEYVESTRIRTKAIEVGRQLVRDDPDNADYRWVLIKHLNRVHYHAVTPTSEAEAENVRARDEALEHTRELATRNPKNRLYCAGLSEALYQKARHLLESGRPADARPYSVEARSRGEEYAREWPKDLDHDMLRHHHRLLSGLIDESEGKWAEALAAYDALLPAYDFLRAKFPNRGELVDLLQSLQFRRGRVFLHMGDLPRARSAFIRHAAVTADLHKNFPQVASYKTWFWQSLYPVSMLGETTEPEELRLLEVVNRIHDDAAKATRDGETMLHSALFLAGCPNRALRDPIRAAAQLTEFLGENPRGIDERLHSAQFQLAAGDYAAVLSTLGDGAADNESVSPDRRATLLALRAIALARTGKVEAARREANRLVVVQPKHPTSEIGTILPLRAMCEVNARR